MPRVTALLMYYGFHLNSQMFAWNQLGIKGSMTFLNLKYVDKTQYAWIFHELKSTSLITSVLIT